MRTGLMKRVMAVMLSICMIVCLLPMTIEVEAEAAGGVDLLTCAGFISDHIAQKYIDTMMRYHLNTNSTLQSTLNNGNSVVFMFEGGSDNYWNGSTYHNGVGDVRDQAVCIVVKRDSNGNCYIAYYCENCSSIPDDPKNCTNGVAYSGATTVMDGIHAFYTWNHTGPYGAFQIDLGSGYYTPSQDPNGYTAGASGLNIHTRSTNTCGGAAVGWDWSLGCQVIGSGQYTGNEFNQFMKVVAGISYNVWLDYYNKSFNTISPTGVYKGYYVVDRQLGKMDINGKDYGSGSLIELYNTTALTNITAKSTSARKAAGFSLDYKDQCERYASYCTLEVTADDTEVRGAPCSEGSDPASTLIETYQPGKKVTAVGIYKNLYGNYWYEVLTASGGLGYIYAGNVTYVEDIITDITLTGDSDPDSHVKGATFYVDGTVASKYNQLTSVACYIYDGFAQGGDPVTGASDTPTTNSYTLEYSPVDDATWMGALETGNYTYTITASYANYYATDPTTLKSNTGMLTLKETFFVVIPEAVDVASCQHTNTTYVLEESTCLSDGNSVTACSTCGLVSQSITSGGHSYGAWSTTKQPTCTAAGVSSRSCSACGQVETKSIAPNGHNYSSVIHPATCVEYQRTEYTCDTCGHNYSVYADELMTQWSEVEPEGVDEGLVESKQQYRYSDYETITSADPSVDGYEQIDKRWVRSGSGNIHYATEWPSGFLTSHTLYSQYDKTPYQASETQTHKLEIGHTGKLVGYIYYHWCYGTYTGGPINRTTSKVNDGEHTSFHAFVASIDTMDPTTLTPAPDGSVTYPNGNCCKDSHWYYYFPVYEQTFTEYDAQFTHGRWTVWSDWSDEVAGATDTRKVEERTLYRYVDAQYGDHSWSEGVCTVCGLTEPVLDYYLFGHIDGANYACEEDYRNLGEYLFVDGQLVVTFREDSYVGVKTGDNSHWYMTDGWLGTEVSGAVLYDSNTLVDADKLFVPGGVEVTLTLEINDDGTLTLRYVYQQPIQPGLTLDHPSLSFEDEIRYNVYFTVQDLTHVEEMGLIIFESRLTDGTIVDAVEVIPGYVSYDDIYMVHTAGIPAKMMGDTVYFKIYAKLNDGTYAYSEVAGYHAVAYAQSVLRGDADDSMKALVVSMLNYGAQAQRFFGYKTDALVNASLTAQQQALVMAYDPSMVCALPAVDSVKTAKIPFNGGFSGLYPTVSFDDAFSINYYFTPSYRVDGEMKLYYWSAEDYAAASELSLTNATGSMTTVCDPETGVHWGHIEGIAAKQIDQPWFFVGVYQSEGLSYTTGVRVYSLGRYCQSRAEDENSEIRDLAAATAVYGFYAKTYFEGLTI